MTTLELGDPDRFGLRNEPAVSSARQPPPCSCRQWLFTGCPQ